MTLAIVASRQSPAWTAGSRHAERTVLGERHDVLRGLQAIEDCDQLLRDANTAALRHQTVRVIVPLALVRGTIDFFVPTVVALTGIVWLSVEIW